MSEQVKSNAEFWERDDIRGARHSLDVWASCKWSRLSGCGVAVPTLEAIFEFPEAEVEDGWGMDWKLFERASTERTEAPARMTELAVDVVLLTMRVPALAAGLVLSLYPRSGPYQRDAYRRMLVEPESAIVRAYRPQTILDLTGGLRGRGVQRKIDGLLHQMHRDLCDEIAVMAAMPPEVFAATIEARKVPSHASNRKSKHDFRQVLIPDNGQNVTYIAEASAIEDYKRRRRHP